MKLLVDMNLSPRWVEFLARSDVAAIHWSTIGPGTATDVQIMAHARASNLVVLTHDLDFGAILAASQGDGPSVVQIRGDNVAPEKIGATIVRAIRQMFPELKAGALLTVDPRRTRLRLLPLRKNTANR